MDNALYVMEFWLSLLVLKLGLYKDKSIANGEIYQKVFIPFIMVLEKSILDFKTIEKLRELI